jgi:VWFA-related protein
VKKLAATALLGLTTLSFASAQVPDCAPGKLSDSEKPGAQGCLIDDKKSSNPGAGTLLSNTELVMVPVQVRDASGKPLPKLSQSDFVLRADGKVQPIKIFEESGGLSEGTNPAGKPATTSGAAVQKEFSNVPEGGMPQQLLIIAIDRVNTSYVEQGRVRQELLKYFSKDLPEQPFELVAITSEGLVQIRSFSSDPKALLDALRHEHGKLGKSEQEHESVTDSAPQRCRFCGDEIGAYHNSVETKAINSTLRSFVQLEQAYAGTPGRKSVIWLSADMPDVEAIATILNRGNIALYPVNLGGIKADPQLLVEEQLNSDIPKDDNGMRELASRTGGRYCIAMTELKTCIGQAVEDSANYYLLGFYVPQQDRKVGWHKLEVKLMSGYGKVRSRSGYYLEPRATAPTETEIVTSLMTAAGAQIGYTGVAFSVERLADSPGSAHAPSSPVGFRIRVPASSVLLESGQQNLSYEVAMVALSEKGDPTSALQTIRLDLNAEQTQHALAKGWRYDETVPPANSATAVKFIIRDNGTGKIGSVVVPMPTGVGGG